MIGLNRICVCGHTDSRHADDNSWKIIPYDELKRIDPKNLSSPRNPKNWGVGKCELCNCSSFEEETKNDKITSETISRLKHLIREK